MLFLRQGGGRIAPQIGTLIQGVMRKGTLEEGTVETDDLSLTSLGTDSPKNVKCGLIC